MGIRQVATQYHWYCEGCGELATHSIVGLDSTSYSSLFKACVDCLAAILTTFLYADDGKAGPPGYEIRRLPQPRLKLVQ